METQTIKLAKVVGWFTIMASAASNEYGAGINAVPTSTLGPYPGVGSLVPLVVLVAGLILIPKVFMFQRFGRVINTSGGEYTWISRALHPRIGFYVQFLYYASLMGAIGFVTYLFGSTLATTLVNFGVSTGIWFGTFAGHVVIGLLLIWIFFGLHITGVRTYGILVDILFFAILAGAIMSIVIGLHVSSNLFSSTLSSKVFHGPVPSTTLPPFTYAAFLGAVGLNVFSYGGLSSAPMLGGEAKNANRNMPIGIVAAWAVALILYTLVTFATFHAVGATNILALINSNHSVYATVPGVLSLTVPTYVGDIFSIIILIIIAKTVMPLLMGPSRVSFEWGKDSLLPKIWTHTNKNKAPDFSLFIVALFGSIFLIDASIIGVNIVAFRSISLLVIILFMGIAVLFLNTKKSKKDWEKSVTTTSMIVAAIAGVIVALVFIPSVVILPNVVWYLQPSIQSVVAVLLSEIIYEAARLHVKSQSGADLSQQIISKIPEE
ncbi:MAG: amino acid permease [Thermoplasmatales archaeon B_DKE]|nr:MAG: amino acid permease [Thermoplasmatales archaeon B_DKE]